jgi:hypothetical protein
MGIGFPLLQLIVELILTSCGARRFFGWFGEPGRRHAPMAGMEETGAVSFWCSRCLHRRAPIELDTAINRAISECPNE